MANLDLEAAVTLPLLTPAITIEPVVNTGDVATTLPMIVPAVELRTGIQHTITAAITLSMVVPAVSVVPLGDGAVTIAVLLPMQRSRIQVQNHPVVRLYTGPILQNGGGIFEFVGFPNLAIDWTIVEGDGTLEPLSLATDAQGCGYCRYEPGSYTGPLEIGVVYSTNSLLSGVITVDEIDLTLDGDPISLY